MVNTILEFEKVDAGCWMLNDDISQRWKIQQPKGGYMPTKSKMWDTLIEDFENPNTKPLKFLGSFQTKQLAIKHIQNLIVKGETFNTIIATENEFYNTDYTSKN